MAGADEAIRTTDGGALTADATHKVLPYHTLVRPRSARYSGGAWGTQVPRRDRQGTQGWGRAVSGVRTAVNVSARSQCLGLISLEYRGKVRPNMAGDSMGRASKIRDRPSSSSPTSRAWSLPQNEVSQTRHFIVLSISLRYTYPPALMYIYSPPMLPNILPSGACSPASP